MRQLVLFFVGIFIVCSCESHLERDFRKGERQETSKDYVGALERYYNVVRKDPQSPVGIRAARRGAQVAFFDLKNYPKAEEFYRSLIQHSDNPEERVEAQKKIAEIYLDHNVDFFKASQELMMLLHLLTDIEEQNEYRLKLARALFYLNDFQQAESEADVGLLKAKNESQIFQFKMLKANISIAKKDLNQATVRLQTVISEHPTLAKQDSVFMTLALTQEEKKDYKAAVETLKKARPDHPLPDYIDLRLKRLEERIKNAPGSRGFRK